MAGGALFMPCGIDSYVALIQSLNLPTAIVTIIKFLIGFPFAFHYFIGIRFVCFNMVKLLVLKEAYQSAYIAILAAGAVAAAFAVFFWTNKISHNTKTPIEISNLAVAYTQY